VKDIKLVVGEKIRSLRKERGLSQEELGAKAELHYTYIGAVERGEKNCSITTLARIAQGLNVEMGELVGNKETTLDLNRLKEGISKDLNFCPPGTIRLIAELTTKLKSPKSRPGPRK
jgi:transcriptional regulator with XRE-family HTH domain